MFIFMLFFFRHLSPNALYQLLYLNQLELQLFLSKIRGKIFLHTNDGKSGRTNQNVKMTVSEETEKTTTAVRG